RWPFVRNLATLLIRDYLVSPPGQWVSITAALHLLECVLLLVVVVRQMQGDVKRSGRVIVAFAIAASAASIASVVQLTTTMFGVIRSWNEIPARLLSSRIAFVNDANAAGSFFAAAGFVVLALAVRSEPRSSSRRLWEAMVGVVLLTLLVTGS